MSQGMGACAGCSELHAPQHGSLHINVSIANYHYRSFELAHNRFCHILINFSNARWLGGNLHCGAQMAAAKSHLNASASQVVVHCPLLLAAAGLFDRALFFLSACLLGVPFALKVFMGRSSLEAR